ncbi:MAG: Asp-tRNA(Asn)/Glu-tRNA(Gln) amidotransferase subunit GatA [Ruminococcus sp.]
MGQIKKLHGMLTGKKISCKELTEEYLRAIERDNASLGAYVSVTADRAMASAEEADRKIAKGEDIHLLTGIPMTLKDNISTKDLETTCCSKILRGYKPIYDATVWKNLKDRGAVILGKTNMDEFAMGSSCENSCYFPARNPHNTACVAGGSSGGGASAVAGNLAVYALGSDTGGSIRQPASFCGIVGLKPTYGAVSRYGLIAYASSLDQIGPLASNVEDTAVVFDAISGFDPLDSTTKPEYKGNTVSALDNSIKGKTIGVAREFLEGLRPGVLKALQKTISTFESLGARVVYFDMPVLKYALPVYYILACAEASSNLGRYDGIRYGYKTEFYDSVHDMVCKTRSEGFGEEVKRRILLGTYVLSAGYYDAYYKKAQNLRGALVSAFEKAFESCDVILAPVAPSAAFELGAAITDPVETYQADICTVPVNIAGLPAVSFPCDLTDEGMPVGAQLIGKKFSESMILNFAYKFEQANRTVQPADWGVKL